MVKRNRLLDEIIRKKVDTRDMAAFLGIDHKTLIEKVTCEIPMSESERIDYGIYLWNIKDELTVADYYKYLYQIA